MENEEKEIQTITEEKMNEQEQPKKKLNKKKFFTIFGIVVLLVYGFYIYLLSLPLKNDDIYCEYKGKFNKIVCTQTGDVVPAWLQIDDNQFLKYLGIGNEYSMKLVLSHNNKDYKVLEMTDKVFITDMHRKFIYELKEQTYGDWLDFKKYTTLQGCKTSNWGSIILYCSENNLQEDICKRLKKQYKK